MTSKKTNIMAVIQARMGSTRLPGKVLMEIGGKPALYHVVSRVRKAAAIDRVVVAATRNPIDDPLQACCETLGVACFRGDEDDVLDRFYQTAVQYPADVIVRITADCPLLDPNVTDHVVHAFLEGQCDYASNTQVCTYPDGLDTEVFSFQALERAWREARLLSEREHVTPYIKNHPEIFRLKSVENDCDLSALRWTLDEPTDLEFIRAVYENISCEFFGMEEILTLLQSHPDIGRINQGIERNEGYQKSLREDRIVK
ncbi:MAG: glycosyltransferase family protein [Candidatus Omnitrophica bacterium]|nr:glycosyltransferase family protein [Candidatus Omnitrophota bacterium]